jgi:hypothetical protein
VLIFNHKILPNPRKPTHDNFTLLINHSKPRHE